MMWAGLSFREDKTKQNKTKCQVGLNLLDYYDSTIAKFHIADMRQ